jgi:hypothetical protein
VFTGGCYYLSNIQCALAACANRPAAKARLVNVFMMLNERVEGKCLRKEVKKEDHKNEGLLYSWLLYFTLHFGLYGKQSRHVL